MVLTVTAEVVIVKAGETVAPAGTVTDADTAANVGLVLARVTTIPAEGAALPRVTVFRIDDAPPFSVAGDSFRAVKAGCTSTVNVAV